jgi:signal peptidase II
MTCMAFSMFEGMRWLFLALVVLFFVGVGLLIRKGILRKPAELWCLAAVGGGALGNAVDRVLTGEVVDMIETEFITFPVFNVADCFITCGAVALAIVLLFFDRHDEKVNSEE